MDLLKQGRTLVVSLLVFCIALDTGPVHGLAPMSEYRPTATMPDTELSEQEFYREIVRTVRQHPGPEPFVLAVAGGAGVGKSTLTASSMKRALEKRGLRVFVLPMDGFFHDPQTRARRVAAGDEWSPRHMRLKAARRALNQIHKNIRTLSIRRYVRTKDKVALVSKRVDLKRVDVVLVDHLYALSDREGLGNFLEFVHLPIFLETRPELMYAWRWKQEQKKGRWARSQKAFQRHWEKGIWPDWTHNIAPSASNAFYHLFANADHSLRYTRRIPKGLLQPSLWDQRRGVSENIVHYVKSVDTFFEHIADTADTKIAIVHDRDADGLIAAAIMYNTVRLLKPNVQIALVATTAVTRNAVDQARDADHLIILGLALPEKEKDIAAWKDILHKPILHMDCHDQGLRDLALRDIKKMQTQADSSQWDPAVPEASGILCISPSRLRSRLEDSALYNTGLIVLDIGGWLIGPSFSQRYGWLGAMSALSEGTESAWKDRLAPYRRDRKQMNLLKQYSGVLNQAKAIEGLSVSALVDAIVAAEGPEAIPQRMPVVDANALFNFEDSLLDDIADRIKQAVREVPKNRWVVYEMRPEDQRFWDRAVHPARSALNMFFAPKGALAGSGRTVLLIERQVEKDVPVGIRLEMNTDDPRVNAADVMKIFFGGVGNKKAAGASLEPKENQSLDNVMQTVRAQCTLAELSCDDPALRQQIDLIRQTGLLPQDMMQYGLSLRGVLNPAGKDVSVAYGAAKSDVIWAYLTTNFSYAMFVDKQPVSLKKFQDAMAKWDTLPSSHGYFALKHATGISSGQMAEGVDVEQLLIEELKVMGVSREALALSRDRKGRPQLVFRLPGDAKSRRIVFQQGDIKKPSLELLKEWKTLPLDVYLEKGVQGVQSNQQEYLPKIAGVLAPDGLVVFHPMDSESGFWDPHLYLNDVMTERVPNAQTLLEPFLGGGLTQDHNFLNRLKGLGCDGTVWQKKETFAALPALSEEALNLAPDARNDYVWNHSTALTLSVSPDASSENVFYEIARRIFPRAHELGSLKVIDVIKTQDNMVTVQMQVDKRQFVLMKVYIDPPMSWVYRELRWHPILENNGIVRVPRMGGAYRLDTSFELNKQRCYNSFVFVFEWLPGKTLEAATSEFKNQPERLREFYGVLGLKMGQLAKRFQVPSARKAHAQGYFNMFYERLLQLRRSGYLLSHAHVDVLQKLLMKRLGRKLPAVQNFTLSHGDLHGGNTMVLPDDSLALFDLSTMSLDFPERDIAKLDTLVVDATLAQRPVEIAQKAVDQFLENYLAATGDRIDSRRLLLIQAAVYMHRASSHFWRRDERRGYCWLQMAMQKLIPGFSLGKDLVHDDLRAIRLAWLYRIDQLDKNRCVFGLDDLPHYRYHKLPIGPANLQAMDWAQVQTSFFAAKHHLPATELDMDASLLAETAA